MYHLVCPDHINSRVLHHTSSNVASLVCLHWQTQCRMLGNPRADVFTTNTPFYPPHTLVSSKYTSLLANEHMVHPFICAEQETIWKFRKLQSAEQKSNCKADFQVNVGFNTYGSMQANVQSKSEKRECALEYPVSLVVKIFWSLKYMHYCVFVCVCSYIYIYICMHVNHSSLSMFLEQHSILDNRAIICSANAKHTRTEENIAYN